MGEPTGVLPENEAKKHCWEEVTLSLAVVIEMEVRSEDELLFQLRKNEIEKYICYSYIYIYT